MIMQHKAMVLGVSLPPMAKQKLSAHCVGSLAAHGVGSLAVHGVGSLTAHDVGSLLAHGKTKTVCRVACDVKGRTGPSCRRKQPHA